MNIHVKWMIAILVCFSTTAGSCDEPERNEPEKSEPEQQAPFTVQLKQPDDELTVAYEKVVVDIRSPRGISHAVLNRTGEKWPEVMMLRLHLKGLEDFQIITDQHRLKLFVSNGPQPELTVLQVNPDTGEETKLDRDSPWWIPLKRMGADGKPSVEVPLTDGYLEIPLPKKLLKTNPESITFKWVDFYR